MGEGQTLQPSRQTQEKLTRFHRWSPKSLSARRQGATASLDSRSVPRPGAESEQGGASDHGHRARSACGLGPDAQPADEGKDEDAQETALSARFDPLPRRHGTQ